MQMILKFISIYHNSSTAFELLNRWLDDIKEWMSARELKLNPDKIEFIVFG